LFCILYSYTILLAKQHLEKLRKEEVSIDWAHRVLISSIRQQRMLKMMAIADDRHFTYDNEIELVQFVASEMEKEGLDRHQDYVTAINRVRLTKNICNILYLVNDWLQHIFSLLSL